MTNEQMIIDDGDLRKYRTEIPNMADDDLDPYQYRLYGHYKRVCGASGGSCYESVKTTASNCKMSVGKVVSTRKWLESNGWITCSESNRGTIDIRIIDRWPENFARYGDRSRDEQGVHVVNDPVHVVNDPVHVVNQRNNQLRKNTEKKEPVKNPPSISPAELYRRTMAAEQLEALDAANVDLMTFRAMVDEILAATGKTTLADTPTQMGQRALNDAKETALTAIGMGFKTPQDIIEARRACPWDDPHNSQIIGYLGKKPKPQKVDQRSVPAENRVKPGAAAAAMESIRRRRMAMEAA